MANIYGLVAQDSVAATGEGVPAPLKANKMGFLIVMDFYTQMAIEGRIFQVRAGTITTPLVGDVLITDAKCEYCVDPGTGYTIFPVYQNISVRLGTGTVHEYATKSVATASTAGTAFVPLPLLTGGAVSNSTARVAAAGGVTVTAELATTTARHWAYSNPLAVAAGHGVTQHEWTPRTPPRIDAGYCLYTQIAATGTGPSYYANLDFLELPTTGVS